MANKTIKGLTVEIGGDTTKLGKALDSVEKKSRDLSSELGQINKLLKMDPGNADLLAQKQKVLAEAVEQTSTKLKTLKEAEKQVQKQFERGEVSEEQVRALKREIIETEKKLNGYEKASKETADEIKKLGKKNKDAGKDVDKLGKEAKDTGKDLDKAGDKASSFGDKVKKAGGIAAKGFAAVGAVVAAGTAALVASAEASREYRREMGKLDTAFTTNGHSSEAATKTYKSLQGVLGETDQAVEAANHLAKLTNNEKDLQKWTDICTGVYATFGASLPIEGLTEAANETAKVGQVTGPLADALNWAGVSEDAFNESLAACSNEQERQALIMNTLNGLYSDAAKKYKETNAEVIRANQANEEWASSVAAIGAEIEPLLTDVKLLGASLLKDLVPGIKEVAGAFRGMLNGDEGAAANLGEALSGIFSDLLNKITELLPAAAEMGISLITTLTTSIIMALPQLVSTGAQVIMSLIQGLTTAIPQIIAATSTVIPHLVTALTDGIPLMVQGAVNLLLAICQAVPLLIEPLTNSIGPIVITIINALLNAIPILIQGAVLFLQAIVQAIPIICQTLAPQIAPIITTICDALISNIDVLLNGALDLLDAIVQAIPLICQALLPEVPRIVQTLSDKLVQMVPQLLDAAITLLFALIDAIPILLNSLLPQIPVIVDSVVKALINLIPVLLQAAVKLFFAVITALGKMIVELGKQLPNVWKTIQSGLDAIPRVIGGILTKAINKVVEWGSNLASKGLSAAKKLMTSVVDGIKSIPDKIKTVGKNLVTGLWNGISDKASWLKDKIKGWVGNVTDFLKKLFGINSPSKVTAWMGEMIDEGFAKGIEDNTKAPMSAMSDLTDGMLDEAGELNGVTLERQLKHTFSTPAAVSTAETGMLEKLDKILNAIERGQVLTIDGDKLVGATAKQMDSALGRRRELAARGAM